jgi:hypothetical protein
MSALSSFLVPALQHPDRLGAEVLAAFLQHGNSDAGRQIGDAHRTVGLVDGVAARARGAAGVDAQLLVDKLDPDVVVDLSSTDRRRCEAEPRTAAS